MQTAHLLGHLKKASLEFLNILQDAAGYLGEKIKKAQLVQCDKNIVFAASALAEQVKSFYFEIERGEISGRYPQKHEKAGEILNYKKILQETIATDSIDFSKLDKMTYDFSSLKPIGDHLQKWSLRKKFKENTVASTIERKREGEFNFFLNNLAEPEAFEKVLSSLQRTLPDKLPYEIFDIKLKNNSFGKHINEVGRLIARIPSTAKKLSLDLSDNNLIENDAEFIIECLMRLENLSELSLNLSRNKIEGKTLANLIRLLLNSIKQRSLALKSFVIKLQGIENCSSLFHYFKFYLQGLKLLKRISIDLRSSTMLNMFDFENFLFEVGENKELAAFSLKLPKIPSFFLKFNLFSSFLGTISQCTELKLRFEEKTTLQTLSVFAKVLKKLENLKFLSLAFIECSCSDGEMITFLKEIRHLKHMQKIKLIFPHLKLKSNYLEIFFTCSAVEMHRLLTLQLQFEHSTINNSISHEASLLSFQANPSLIQVRFSDLGNTLSLWRGVQNRACMLLVLRALEKKLQILFRRKLIIKELALLYI